MRSKKTAMHILGLGLVVLLAVAPGCGRKPDNRADLEARELYVRSLELTRLYTDSMRNAKDSAEVTRLEKAFDAAITRLGMEYPADTHLGISEGENDTLTNRTLRYVELRDSLLYALAHPAAPSDTLPSDSTASPD